MTKSEYLALSPRERDAIISEKVMELGPHTHEAAWKYDKKPGEGYGDYEGWWCTECYGPEMPPSVRLNKPKPETHQNYGLKHYTTTWEGMGLVVEKMHSLGWQVEISMGVDLEGDYCGGPPTVVRMRRPKKYTDPNGAYLSVYSPSYTPEEESHPLTICFAALKAKGEIE